MPRLIETTWFEDLGFLNQPIFDFKLAILSIRQMAYLVLFAGLAYMFCDSVVPLFAAGLMPQVIGGVAVFAAGMAFFGRKGRVFSPEWYVLYFARKYLRRKTSGGEKFSRTHAPKPKAEEPRPMIAPLGEPTRIAGVLFDPSSGAKLQNTGFEVEVDGKPYYSGRTGSDGSYSFVFTPPCPGRFSLVVRPKGHSKNAAMLQIETSTSSTPSTGTPEPRTVGRGSLGAAVGATEKPQKIEEMWKYTYELFPVNFVDLSDDDQDKLVNSFRGFLNSLDQRVKVTVVRVRKEVRLGNTPTKVEFFKFFIQSVNPIDAQLNAGGFKYQRTLESPEPDIVHSFRTFVTIRGGMNQRTFTIYKMPARLIEGFPTELYPWVDRVSIVAKPLPQGDAAQKVEKFLTLQRGTLRSGVARQEDVSKGNRALIALNRLTAGGSRLFEVTVNLVVGGRNAKELEENAKHVSSVCRGRLIDIDDPMFVQDLLLRGELGKRMFVDTITLGAFFPFVSADVMETPGGVCFGVNMRTGAPVIYDPYIRSNQNFAIIGKSGSGKSFASKLYLTRLFERHPDLAFFIVDPENEYVPTALELDRRCQVIHVTRNREMGLDPFKIFPNEKDIVLDMLIQVLDLSEGESDLTSELRVKIQRANTMQDLRKLAGRKLKKRLDGLLKGPEQFLFKGKSAEMRDRVVFSLRELHQAMKSSERRVGALQMASLLLFGKLWKKLEELPRDRLKVVIVDEVWLYTTLSASASFLEHVSRRGRRRNVVFVFASQRPDDVLASEAGRAAMQNCATKVFFQQDESTAELVRSTFGLTERESDESKDFLPGRAILMARGIKVPLEFISTPEEYVRFTTKPTEVI